jgi:hypothetical protein
MVHIDHSALHVGDDARAATHSEQRQQREQRRKLDEARDHHRYIARGEQETNRDHRGERIANRDGD